MKMIRRIAFESSTPGSLTIAPISPEKGLAERTLRGCLRWAVPGLLLAVMLLHPRIGAAQTPTLVIDDASVFETDAGTAILSLPVRFVGAQPNGVTWTATAIPLTGAGFNPATGGAACGGSVDFVQVSSGFNIPPNTANGTLSVNIAICPDTIIEPNEQIFVSLNNVSGAVCLEGTCNGVGTIRNNDGPPTISINDVSVREPVIRGDSMTVGFTVSLSHSRPTNVSVNFATREGTAKSSGPLPDYRARTGTVMIPGNQNLLAGTAAVTILGDQIAEASQNFFVDLSSTPVNGSISDGTGQATIQDNTVGFATGTFELSPVGETVVPGDTIPFVVVWTVPDGEVWRDLRTIDFRIRRGASMALWIRWDEITNRFSLCEGAGKNNDGNNGSALDAVCTPGGLAGTPVVLETAFGRLDLANSSVVGSGPTGPSVALNLAITPGDDATGRYELELAASDRFGNVEDFSAVGALRVQPVESVK